ncbi:MAG: hypothetical protein OXI79_14765 [Gammaproteobacteria bacterium]|nr:hypothetical protein [Gammaproteobacteria bacterium]
MRFVAAFVAATLAVPAVHAEPSIDAARAAFDEGRYLEAADMGESLDTSGGYALAADALSVHGHYIAADADKQPLLQRARSLADKAVALDETSAEARFQVAHAMGRYAQSIGPTKALRQGFVGGSREAIEAALEIDPDMAEARLSLASWHADVVDGFGRMLGRMTYGATVQAAIDNYERTLELAPDEKVAYVEFARGLAAIGGRKERARVRELLNQALKLPVRNDFDRIIHERATAHLESLDAP